MGYSIWKTYTPCLWKMLNGHSDSIERCHSKHTWSSIGYQICSISWQLNKVFYQWNFRKSVRNFVIIWKKKPTFFVFVWFFNFCTSCAGDIVVHENKEFFMGLTKFPEFTMIFPKFSEFSHLKKLNDFSQVPGMAEQLGTLDMYTLFKGSKTYNQIQFWVNYIGKPPSLFSRFNLIFYRGVKKFDRNSPAHKTYLLLL